LDAARSCPLCGRSVPQIHFMPTAYNTSKAMRYVITSATRTSCRTHEQARADEPVDEGNDVVMRISIDVGEQLSNVLLDLLNVMAGLQPLQDQASGWIEAVDEAAFLIEEDGTVAVMDDVD